MPRETWIPIAVPPIIDSATFEAAQVQLQRNKRLAKRNRKYEYLLVGGRLRCGQCGSTMSGGNKQGIPYYLCGRRAFQDAAAAHTRRSIQAREIEPLVWQAVEQALNNPALMLPSWTAGAKARAHSKPTWTASGNTIPANLPSVTRT